MKIRREYVHCSGGLLYIKTQKIKYILDIKLIKFSFIYRQKLFVVKRRRIKKNHKFFDPLMKHLKLPNKLQIYG